MGENEDDPVDNAQVGVSDENAIENENDKMGGKSNGRALSQFEALVQVRKEHLLNPERSPSPSIFSPSTDWTESSSDESSSSEQDESDDESSEESMESLQHHGAGGFVASA